MGLGKSTFVAATVAGLLAGIAAGWHGPMAGDDAALLQFPTIVAILLLVAAIWRQWLRTAAFASAAAFLGLHTLASYYGYCNVPYEDWLQAIGIPNLWGCLASDRNHFDRLLHLSYGLLLWLPARQIAERWLRIGGWRASWIAIEFVLASSGVYEIVEWLIAVAMAPEIADRYNGQQGDVWDAQKDMALALCGAIAAAMMHQLATSFRRSIPERDKATRTR